ncbi:hypothetical protein [Caldilinea sp.]|uniref:DUF7718 family protein n=1 Tax=Caldilinea sp. TaxID=2293560 RepID=UPI0021DB9183|nr:hypothetical protein [Caldilinea sp.]GIV67883.1 MAG: hypothetical protein KatS3mg048_0745 [Caldilinea sp.]
MRQVEFRRLLDELNALRVWFEIDHGLVIGFVVQLECIFQGSERWTPVVRYDTAHGFAHRDEMHPSGATVKTPMGEISYTEALQRAMEDLTKNWQMYRRRYEQWIATE